MFLHVRNRSANQVISAKAFVVVCLEHKGICVDAFHVILQRTQACYCCFLQHCFHPCACHVIVWFYFPVNDFFFPSALTFFCFTPSLLSMISWENVRTGALRGKVQTEIKIIKWLRRTRPKHIACVSDTLQNIVFIFGEYKYIYMLFTLAVEDVCLISVCF